MTGDGDGTAVVTWGQLRRALTSHATHPGAVIDVYCASTRALAISYGNPSSGHIARAVDRLETDPATRDVGVWVRVHTDGTPAATYAVPGRLWLDDDGAWS